MGISVADARNLSLWEYEAMLTENNRRVNEALGNADPVEAPTAEIVERRLDQLRNPKFMN